MSLGSYGCWLFTPRVLSWLEIFSGKVSTAGRSGFCATVIPTLWVLTTFVHGLGKFHVWFYYIRIADLSCICSYVFVSYLMLRRIFQPRGGGNTFRVARWWLRERSMAALSFQNLKWLSYQLLNVNWAFMSTCHILPLG